MEECAEGEEIEGQSEDIIESGNSVKRRRLPSLLWHESYNGTNGEQPHESDRSRCKHCTSVIDHHKHLNRAEKQLKNCSSFINKMKKHTNYVIPGQFAFMKSPIKNLIQTQLTSLPPRLTKNENDEFQRYGGADMERIFRG